MSPFNPSIGRTGRRSGKHALGVFIVTCAMIWPSSGCKRRTGTHISAPNTRGGSGRAVTMTPQADASELGPSLREAFILLVEAGDNAFSRDEDLDAIKSWTKALELIGDQGGQELKESILARVVVAHARGGGASLALELIKELSDSSSSSEAVRFARARALERSEGEGTRALAAWFEAWAAAAREGDAAASSYARLRVASLWTRHLKDPSDLPPLINLMQDPQAQSCARAFSGASSVVDDRALWLGGCAPGERGTQTGSHKVGLLLPRSGPLAALADGQLAALATATRLVTAGQAGLVLEFRDAGSDVDSAVAGAEQLLEAGVTVIVGPVGAKQTRAVAAAVAGRARVITPGPPAGLAEGIAPTLEDRVAALARRGLELGCSGSWTLLHAKGGYGRRGARHFKHLGETSGFEALVRTGAPTTLTYAGSETSFAKLLRSKPRAFTPGHCVMVIDTLARTSAIARQLRRDGVTLGGAGVHYFSTAEGLDARALVGESILAGTIVAPVALPAPRSAFQDSYRLATGQPADDQALLLWSAISRALWEHAHGIGAREPARVAQFGEGGTLNVTTQE